MRWLRYVAVGDSFTEGIGDPRPEGRDRGWADRVAEVLSAREPGFRYANLAVRGRSLGQITEEQVPAAVTLRPDMVSFAGGINDALRRTWDLTVMAQNLEQAIGQLATTDARIVIVTFGRPSRRSPILRTLESRLSHYREVTYDIADRHGADVVDFWEHSVFNDPRFWSDDRLHLNPVGHERVAMAVLDALGVPLAKPWWEPLPPVRPPSTLTRVGRNATWAGKHAAPWLGRRLTGRSSGDGVLPKRTELLPL